MNSWGEVKFHINQHITNIVTQNMRDLHSLRCVCLRLVVWVFHVVPVNLLNDILRCLLTNNSCTDTTRKCALETVNDKREKLTWYPWIGDAQICGRCSASDLAIPVVGPYGHERHFRGLMSRSRWRRYHHKGGAEGWHNPGMKMRRLNSRWSKGYLTAVAATATMYGGTSRSFL